MIESCVKMVLFYGCWQYQILVIIEGSFGSKPIVLVIKSLETLH